MDGGGGVSSYNVEGENTEARSNAAIGLSVKLPGFGQ